MGGQQIMTSSAVPASIEQTFRRHSWIPTGSWILYDLANTVYAATVTYLLVPEITDGGNRFTTAVGATQTASMILAGLLVPVLGGICDRTGNTRFYLVVSTSALGLGLVLLHNIRKGERK